MGRLIIVFLPYSQISAALHILQLYIIFLFLGIFQLTDLHFLPFISIDLRSFYDSSSFFLHQTYLDCIRCFRASVKCCMWRLHYYSLLVNIMLKLQSFVGSDCQFSGLDNGEVKTPSHILLGMVERRYEFHPILMLYL